MSAMTGDPVAPPWYRIEGEAAILHIKAIPGARKTAFAGIRGDEVAIRVAAQPEKGKANAELERGVAKLLGVSRSQVRIVSGETARKKSLAIPKGALCALIALLEDDSS